MSRTLAYGNFLSLSVSHNGGTIQRVADMSTAQMQSTQLELGDTMHSNGITVFCPPGITVETAKYPILMSGILAATQPTEFLSIYDHPTAWRRLDREAILSMRRNLFRLLFPADARNLVPKYAIESLQKIALSVSPVALGVEASTLPPRQLRSMPGELPSGSDVRISSLEILSEPEISRVAQRISEKDIPSADAICQLLDYDYPLEQVARMLSVGLLGRHGHRKLVPTRNAFKIVIDALIDKAILDLSECPPLSGVNISKSQLFGDTFHVVSIPGEPRVDYIRMEVVQNRVTQSYSYESTHYGSSDAKAAMYGAHARFPIYQDMLKERKACHTFVFHLNRDSRNDILGPWIVRAGIEEALCNESIELDSTANLQTILEALLYPNLGAWTNGTPLMKRLGFESFTALERYA